MFHSSLNGAVDRQHNHKKSKAALLGARRKKRVRLEALEGRTLFAVNPTVITLLVPYTSAAMQGAGGQTAIVNKINRSVADLNQTLANSQVNATVRLVGTMQTSFTEDPSGVTADLTALPTVADVAAMKTSLGADLVDMWVGPASNTQRPPDAEGIAGEPTSLTTADPMQGYAVQWWGDSNANLTVHEIGHMLGGGHVQGQDPAPHVIPYAYDYIATVGNATYGTAIDDQAVTGGLIPYYSNPNVFFRGVALGQPDTAANAADNANVMNQIAPLIATYSTTPAPAVTQAPLAGLDQVQNTTGQNSFTFDVTYYDQTGVDVTTLGNNNIQVTGSNGFNTTATFNGILIDGNLTPIAGNTVNASVIQAQYTVNTTGAPGDLAQYNFALNANQVKNTAGLTTPAGPLLIASGANPNTANPTLLPRYGGDGTGFAVDAGNLTGASWKITDFAGPYFYKEGTNYEDGNLYRFSLSSAGTVGITVNGGDTFALYQDGNGDGVLDPGSEVIQPVSPGVYNLQAGTNYYLQVGASWSNGTYAAGGVFTAEINGAGSTPITTKSLSLSGEIFQDTNNNGTQDTGEPGLSGIPVTLTGTDINGNAVAASVMSDTNGNFTFSNLAAANATGYTLAITQPTGTPLETITIGSASGTANSTLPNPSVSGIALSTANASGYIFVESPIPAGAKVSGQVYNDQNGNDALDTGEPGVPGAMVTLTGTSDAGAAVNLTTTSAADGTYSFTNVPSVTGQPGYTIQIIAPPGYNNNPPNLGSGNTLGYNGAATGLNKIGQVFMNPGDALIAYNFPVTGAPSNQTPPAAAAVTITTQQNQPVSGNVLNASIPGTTPTQTASASIARAGKTVAAAKTNKKQSVMYAGLEVMPQHALHFSLNPDGTFNYTPMPGFFGKDVFKYVCVMKATGRCSNTAAPVNIIVRHVDQAPFSNTEVLPTLHTAQGTPVAVDLDPFVTTDRKVSQLHFILAKPGEGTFTLEKDGHTAIFTPNPSFAGVTTVQFRASDGIKTSGLLSLSVQVQPIFVNLSAADFTVSTTKDKPLLINVLSHVIDTVKGATVGLSIVSGPTSGKAKLVKGGKILYQPSHGATGTDSIVYKVTDTAGNTETGTITIDLA